MTTLLWKEIRAFFGSLTGYIVVILFTLASSLFMWVFPGSLNIPDSGYATMDSFFTLAPWVFLFLVPAITMRIFSEERKTGTMELLVTRPLTMLQITLAKYLASVLLVLISILPALISFLSVYLLGNPPGNIDVGGTWGSFIGLFFLASIYASIGLFCSSLTDNQIIAFLLALVLCFFFYIGFSSISSLHLFGNSEGLLIYFGIDDHYRSMSRGVLDSRDIVYFLGIIFLFLLFTDVVLRRRKW